jgi:hypothetical protein
MEETRQATQRFFTDLWHRFNAEWFPALTNFLPFLWQWLQDNRVATLVLSGVILILGCLIVRKAAEHGWNGVRIFWAIAYFSLGLAGMVVVVRSL